MSLGEVVFLVLAGFAGGLSGSIAGLASLASYPALLAIGLAPVTANVTNTVALVGSSIGSISGSRPELRGQRTRLVPMVAAGVAGGLLGGVLLLALPGESFEKVVPFFVAAAAVAMLARRRIVEDALAAVQPPGHDRRVLAAMFAVGIYGGYFGAGAGVIILAVLLRTTSDPLPRANAFKNVVLGAANAVAALGFVLFGPVRWSAAVPLGLGLLVGGRIGPTVVRRAPVGPLRVAIAVAALFLAIKLALDAYA
ncbi:MAG: sulfite exporter TauE/SafE family protein [Ilumatobacteraceae bacterium]